MEPRLYVYVVLRCGLKIDCHNSITILSIFTKFDKMTHFGGLYHVDRKNFEFLKMQYGGRIHVP